MVGKSIRTSIGCCRYQIYDDLNYIDGTNMRELSTREGCAEFARATAASQLHVRAAFRHLLWREGRFNISLMSDNEAAKLIGEMIYSRRLLVQPEHHTYVTQPGLEVQLTEKQAGRLRRVSEALKDESKWGNVTPKDRWRLGRVYDNLLEQLVSKGIQRTGQQTLHQVDLDPEMIARFRHAGGRILITEGRLRSERFRFDMLEIDFTKSRAELIDIAATPSPRHEAKTRAYKIALEKLLGFPVEAKELFYTGSKGELLDNLVEVVVR